MRKKSEVIMPDLLTLGDLIGSRYIEGDIEIVNECNETLIIVSYVEDNVCPLDKTLNEELLDRRIIGQGVRDGRLFIKVEGVEDAI